MATGSSRWVTAKQTVTANVGTRGRVQKLVQAPAPALSLGDLELVI